MASSIRLCSLRGETKEHHVSLTGPARSSLGVWLFVWEAHKWINSPKETGLTRDIPIFMGWNAEIIVKMKKKTCGTNRIWTIWLQVWLENEFRLLVLVKPHLVNLFILNQFTWPIYGLIYFKIYFGDSFFFLPNILVILITLNYYLAISTFLIIIMAYFNWHLYYDILIF